MLRNRPSLPPLAGLWFSMTGPRHCVRIAANQPPRWTVVYALKSLPPPDALIPLFVGLAAAAFIALLAWFIVDGTLSRLWLMGVAPNALTLGSSLLKVAVVRRRVHKWWYNFIGIDYSVEAGGILRVPLTAGEKGVLDCALRAAKKVFGTASVETRLTNRLIIKAGTWTARIDVPQPLLPEGEDEGDADADEDEDDHEATREVSFQLWGYNGKETRIAAKLDQQVAPFIRDLAENMKALPDTRSFWLRIRMAGKNPFLGFYLRDVPGSKVGQFHLDLTDSIAGNTVHVFIRDDGFRVSSEDPSALVAATRSYLSTPAFAHSDGN